jgi:O-methyltransferase involved in polyketide biosynthesis
MQMEKVEFTKAQETNLITLYSRVLHSRSPNAILHDPWAEKALGQINHDFAKFKVGRAEGISFAVRAKKFDFQTAQFIKKYPVSTVLYLGCGLDTRVYRINPPENVVWYDIDFPEVIDLRKRLFPERKDYFMIGNSLAETNWIKQISNDRPTLIIAEGVTMYLNEKVMKNLLNGLVDYFPMGEFMFDAHSKKLINWMASHEFNLRGTGAKFEWGITKSEEIKAIEPRLEFIKQFKTIDLAEYSKMSFIEKVIIWRLELIPMISGIQRPFLFSFNKNTN